MVEIVYVKLSKYSFYTKYVKYLRYIITPRSIIIGPIYIKTIKE
jgi:hypothetical protein